MSVTVVRLAWVFRGLGVVMGVSGCGGIRVECDYL
jgi:hypothetical protein